MADVHTKETQSYSMLIIKDRIPNLNSLSESISLIVDLDTELMSVICRENRI